VQGNSWCIPYLRA